MSSWQTPSYQRILDASKRLHRIVLNEEADDSLAIKASEVLVELEAYKAELRGKPRIKAIDYHQMPARRARTAGPRAIRDVTPTPKESLSSEPPSPHHPPTPGPKTP